MNNDVSAALEELVVAVDSGDYLTISNARKNAVEVLGYEPSREQDYLVSLEITFIGKTPEDAVKEFIKAITEEPATGWVYKTTDDNGDEVYVDAYNWNLSDLS